MFTLTVRYAISGGTQQEVLVTHLVQYSYYDWSLVPLLVGGGSYQGAQPARTGRYE